MTAPSPTVDAVPDALPQADDEERRRRRRLIVLIILGALVALFLAIALWYLIFRKPLPFPIPPAPQDQAPTFSFAVYDVVKPLGVAVNAEGTRLYLTQADGDQATLVLDGLGNRVGTLAPPTTVTAHATQLYVAVNPLTGEVFASDRMAGQVYVYDTDGAYARRLDPGSELAGWQPLALAFDQDGNLYVTDVAGLYHSVREFAPDGRLLRTFGGPGVLNFPNGVAVDDASYVYVSDTNDGRLIVFEPTGAQAGVVSRGPTAAELGLPVGIAIDGADRLFVVDSVAHAVQIYGTFTAGDRAPEYFTSFGIEGTSDGAFEFPNGIAVDGRGRVYVADWNNDRLQVWSY
jgi:DNA-binding beta-propeller fold protein YncE